MLIIIAEYFLGFFQLAALRPIAVALQLITTTRPTTSPGPTKRQTQKNTRQPPVRATTSTSFRPKSVFLYFSVVSRLGAGSRGAGDSDCLPQAVLISGMQALCCLSQTLVLGPGDQVPGEFTAPGYQNRQGYRCAASASSQARPLDPAPKRRPHRNTKQKNRHLQPWVGRDIGSKAGGLFPACYRFKTCF